MTISEESVKIEEARVSLTYAAPQHALPRVALYRVAQFCWIAPLVFGVGCLGLYAVTSNQTVAILGFFTMLIGAGLFGIGMICLIVFWALLLRCAVDVSRRWSKRSAVLLGLLILNFPIAFACAWTGSWLMTRFTVTVLNETNAPVADVKIEIPGDTALLGTIPPGGRVRRTLTIRGEGDLHFSAVQNGTPVSGDANAYLDSGLNGGSGTVVFSSSGATATAKQ